ncbi:hypothetical protein C0995_008293 [Termitomyces sp. Mi166|nr:hypothetical protein C0995_008293 [Termitomyces sp. Mi166\
MPITFVRSVDNDDGSDGKDGMAVKIWVPVLILGIIIVAGALTLCWNRWGSAWLRDRRWPAAAATPATRELTAEQLAGTINGSNTTTGPAASRTRRTRRTRRSPSQISTTSLPAYAKEPGEQELVIFRGPEGMEDTGMPQATVVMEPLSEDGEDTMHSRNSSHSSQYPPIPATPVDTPLLDQSDSSRELPGQPTQSLGDIVLRPSMDTLQSSEERTSLAPAYDDRGEAPAYTETVDNINPMVTTDLPPSPEPVPPRRSGFRTLLHSIPNRFSVHSSSHARAGSSATSENTHGVRETSQSRASHHPSNSGSGSLLSLTHFRTLSRQSNHNLSSPSVISLNSISAPLTHTLTRTEFTYPKSGPTPEQLKLISSPESFARFAVPYGPDAIAFAASASRQDLDNVPPPDFDAPVYASAGPSGLRASSSAADMVSFEEHSVSTSQQEASVESILANDFPASVSSSRRTSTTMSPKADDPLHIPLSSSPATSENGSQPQPEIKPLVLPKPSTIVSGAPPTSYRAPSMLEDVPQSRASSVASFATAVETMASRSPSRFAISPGDSTEDEAETPTIPKMGASHVLASPDAAINRVQSSSTVAVATGASH